MTWRLLRAYRRAVEVRQLEDTDLSASHWLGQPGIDWIMLIDSLARTHTDTVIKPVKPVQLVPFTLRWNPGRARTGAVARFVRTALTADLPAGFFRSVTALPSGGS